MDASPVAIGPADLRVVLVETSHPGNIGAVARAMKNMGLERLVLVRPKAFPHSEASARASGATDLLERAQVTQSLPEALVGCGLVVATTARERDPNIRVLDVRDGAVQMVAEAARGPVALLFGNERTGLTNDEIALANLLLRIPANPEYSSLNLAMAVQIVAYELYRARGATVQASERIVPRATADEMERLYAHLAVVLDEVGFKDRTTSGTRLMERIRRLFNRADLDQNESNIVRGILTAVQQKRRTAGTPHERREAADPAVHREPSRQDPPERP